MDHFSDNFFNIFIQNLAKFHSSNVLSSFFGMDYNDGEIVYFTLSFSHYSIKFRIPSKVIFFIMLVMVLLEIVCYFL